MNIDESIEILNEFNKIKINSYAMQFVNISYPDLQEAIEVLLTAYEKEKEKNESLIKERATEIVYVDKNFIKKDKIKPIQIIDLDGKIHNVYKIKEE